MYFSTFELSRLSSHKTQMHTHTHSYSCTHAYTQMCKLTHTLLMYSIRVFLPFTDYENDGAQDVCLLDRHLHSLFCRVHYHQCCVLDFWCFFRHQLLHHSLAPYSILLPISLGQRVNSFFHTPHRVFLKNALRCGRRFHPHFRVCNRRLHGF